MAFRLLIVDDDPATLLALHDALQTKFPEAEILTAPSAERALIRINSSEAFDIVLSDIRMPGMNGLVLLREIKARFPECIVFLMTGAEGDLRTEALRLGASGFLEKPLDTQQLGTLLAHSLDHGRLINVLHEDPQGLT